MKKGIDYWLVYLLKGLSNVRSQDMDLPGYKLHELKGKEKGTWSVWVSGNWRITFRFDGTDAIDVDYRDYH